MCALMKQVLSNLEELSLDSKFTRMMLECEFPPEFFSKVKVVELCFFTPRSGFYLFGFLQRLPILKKLVIKSSTLKELFLFEEAGGGDQEDAMALSLPRVRLLELNGVDDLKNIWKTSSLLQSPLFEYFEKLKVRSCEDLISLALSFSGSNIREGIELQLYFNLITKL